MNAEKKTAHVLNDLIQIARDGQDFYREAAKNVEDAELSSLFTRIASVKGDIVVRLGRTVAAVGEEPAEHGTLVGSLQETYGKLRATLGDTRYGYVAELEASEDRLLKAFTSAVNDADVPLLAREEIAGLLPQVQQTHAVMRERKHALQHAH